MGEENKAKPQDKNKAKPQSKTKTLDMYQRLADVSLRTSATALTILFAYTFAVGSSASLEFKTFLTGVGLALLFSIILAVFCLFGAERGELRYIRGFAIASSVLMMIAMVFAFILLVVALFGH
jgi:cation transport ATPase